MRQPTENKKIFSLYQVTRSIQKTLEGRYQSSFWVKAELNKLNYYRHSGHCYPELVEKRKGKIIAEMRSILWKTDFRRTNAAFQRVLGEPLKDGIKILFLGRIKYDPHYGLSLQIIDIEPEFTLGDLQKEKQEAIKRLKKEGIFDKNKKFSLPLLPRRIAVISVETSKGYADFLNVFARATEDKGYTFFQMLFPSLLQGDKAVKAMVSQLEAIEKVKHHFDLVTIVRGGGGDIGLSCYNHYELAKKIADFPLPVITGIGHSTNETVAEMVAFDNAITPTKLAEMIVEKYDSFATRIALAEETVVGHARSQLQNEQEKLKTLIRLFRAESQHKLLKSTNQLTGHTRTLIRQALFAFKEEYRNLKDQQTAISGSVNRVIAENDRTLQNQVELIQKDSKTLLKAANEQLNNQHQHMQKEVNLLLKDQNNRLLNITTQIRLIHPENVLKRGYSISYFNGKAIKSAEEVNKGDQIRTMLYDGEIVGTVQDIIKKTKT